METDLLIKEFPLDEGLIYLNHAAVAPWPARTGDAVRQFADEITHTGARHYLTWERKVTELRGQIQRLLHAPAISDIALLKNTSEALSVVASLPAMKNSLPTVSPGRRWPAAAYF